MENKNTTIVILSQKMAGYLLFNGFPMLALKDDMKASGRKIFIFHDTPSLRDCMGRFKDFCR